MRIFSNKRRPVHLGRFPLERIARTEISDAELDTIKFRAGLPCPTALDNQLSKICRDYSAIYERFRTGDVATERAPFHVDTQARAHEMKALALFFDATVVGTCTVPAVAWMNAGELSTHTHALVVLVESRDTVDPKNPAWQLLNESDRAVAKMRSTEVAVIVSLVMRQLGFSAVAHTSQVSDVSLPVLAVQSGLARWIGNTLVAPFIGREFAIAAVTTDMEMAADQALAKASRFEGGLSWWLGIGGTETWWNRRGQQKRPGEWGPYPMEKIKRVERTTTLIIEDEVPRLPKRAGGFARARMGDFGEKAAREIPRFASKTPAGTALRALQSVLQPYQVGPVAAEVNPSSLDPDCNWRLLKTLLHHLGADAAGTCEAKRYTWYSHDYEGKPMDLLHKSALVVAIDQGFETMEGSSGDDWVSATQSYRAYLRVL